MRKVVLTYTVKLKGHFNLKFNKFEEFLLIKLIHSNVWAKCLNLGRFFKFIIRSHCILHRDLWSRTTSRLILLQQFILPKFIRTSLILSTSRSFRILFVRQAVTYNLPHCNCELQIQFSCYQIISVFTPTQVYIFLCSVLQATACARRKNDLELEERICYQSKDWVHYIHWSSSQTKWPRQWSV